MSKSIVMSMNDWDTGAVRYMQPKLNERGGKSINVISTQTNRSLHVSTPLLMTWGISDFVGENVPIISNRNTLIGVVSEGDVLKLYNQFQQEIRSIEKS